MAQVHDWFRQGKDGYIGEFVTSFEELQKIVGRGHPHTFPIYKREGPRIVGMTRMRTSKTMLKNGRSSSHSGSRRLVRTESESLYSHRPAYLKEIKIKEYSHEFIYLLASSDDPISIVSSLCWELSIGVVCSVGSWVGVGAHDLRSRGRGLAPAQHPTTEALECRGVFS